MKSIKYILNAHSGTSDSQDAHVLGAASGNYFSEVSIAYSSSKEHLTHIVQEGIRSRFDVICMVGGDGTAHMGANAFFENDQLLSGYSSFAHIPRGRGNDYARTLGVSKDLATAVRQIGTGEKIDVDVIHLNRKHLIYDTNHICLNVLGLGMAGEVSRAAEITSKRWGPKLTYKVASVQVLRAYPPHVVPIKAIDVDGKEISWDQELQVGFLANGKYCGGGMNVAPQSHLQDGMLHLSLVPKMSLPRALFHMPKLTAGKIHKVPGIEQYRVKSIEFSMPERWSPDGEFFGRDWTTLDLDGEPVGASLLEARVLPRALPLIVPQEFVK